MVRWITLASAGCHDFVVISATWPAFIFCVVYSTHASTIPVCRSIRRDSWPLGGEKSVDICEVSLLERSLNPVQLDCMRMGKKSGHKEMVILWYVVKVTVIISEVYCSTQPVHVPPNYVLTRKKKCMRERAQWSHNWIVLSFECTSKIEVISYLERLVCTNKLERPNCRQNLVGVSVKLKLWSFNWAVPEKHEAMNMPVCCLKWTTSRNGLSVRDWMLISLHFELCSCKEPTISCSSFSSFSF